MTEVITYTKPAACDSLDFYVFVDSELLARLGASFPGEAGQTVTHTVVQSGTPLVDSGSVTAHVVTVKAADGCSSNVTVESLKVRLIGFR
jgi:hypothetical protein